ncbi:hypothetical protein LMG31506_06352 [Cupriavidus yeoncheonensis]|uniref:Lipoprotein n=1 Tax=Cupriavidus yeoncheonensis TaxID=1462994 RepID=A0A916J2D6_9BURK|nr:hypothetical protein LMG31506_06352 [Cupriavidus yeoncheonensis]
MKTIAPGATLAPIMLGMVVSMTACNQKTPYEQEVQCRKICGEQGKYGTWETTRPRPPGSKAPLPIEYECVCS